MKNIDYNEYFKYLQTSILRRYKIQMADVYDIIQETLIDYFKKDCNTDYEPGQIKKYLLTRAEWKCKNYFRENAQQKKFLENKDLDKIVDICPRKETRLVIEILLNLTCEKYRFPLKLYYMKRYSIKQIADMYESNESTIKSWLRKGREEIKKNFKDLKEILIKVGEIDGTWY